MQEVVEYWTPSQAQWETTDHDPDFLYSACLQQLESWHKYSAGRNMSPAVEHMAFKPQQSVPFYTNGMCCMVPASRPFLLVWEYYWWHLPPARSALKCRDFVAAAAWNSSSGLCVSEPLCACLKNQNNMISLCKKEAMAKSIKATFPWCQTEQRLVFCC